MDNRFVVRYVCVVAGALMIMHGLGNLIGGAS